MIDLVGATVTRTAIGKKNTLSIIVLEKEGKKYEVYGLDAGLMHVEEIEKPVSSP